MKTSTFLKVFFVSMVFAGAGCSSGGGGGGGGGSSVNTSPASVDDTNKNQAAEGSRVGVRKAITSSNAPIAAVVAPDGLIPAMVDAARGALALANTPVGAEQDVSAQVCPAGGTAIVDFPDNPPQTGVVRSSFRYTNCRYIVGGVTYTINGSGDFEFNQDNGDLEFSYNMTVSDGNQTYSVTATYRCTNNGQDCTYTDNFSEGGVSYQTTNVTVSGNNTTGYNVSATVFIGDLGFVTVTGTNLTLCANGNFGTGSISVTDSSATVVMTVDFPDCDTMVVTFGGNSDTLPQ